MNLEPQNSRRSFPFIFGAKRQSHRPEGGGLGVLGLCLLELVLGGLGTPLGTAEYHPRSLQSEYRGQ